ncbi:MAG: hypothetical protein ABFS86_02965 [Planctomycetota bacterium]
MLRRTLMFGTLALLLAGFTATTADAGETRGTRRGVVVEDEDGRTARRPLPRTTPIRKPEARPGLAPRSTVDRARRTAPRATTLRPHRPTSRVVGAPPRGRAYGRLHPRPLPRPVVRRPVVRRPALRWVPGHFEERVRRVWIPGYYRTERVPARYAVRTGLLGIRYRILIERERTRKVWVEGHVRMKREDVWVPGHWVRAPTPRIFRHDHR